MFEAAMRRKSSKRELGEPGAKPAKRTAVPYYSFNPAKLSTGQRAIAEARDSGFWNDGMAFGRGHGQPYLEPKYADAILKGRKTVEGRPGGGFLKTSQRYIDKGDYINFKVSGQTGRLLAVRALRFSGLSEHCSSRSAASSPRTRLASRTIPHHPLTFDICAQVRVTRVRFFDTFKDMINACTIAALLPDFDGEDVDEAVSVYRAFGTRRGSYAELEAEFGAVAMDIEPLQDPDSDSDSDGDVVIPAVSAWYVNDSDVSSVSSESSEF